MHSFVYTHSPIFTSGEFFKNLYKWAHTLIMNMFVNLCVQLQISQHICRLCHIFTSNLATTTIPQKRLCHSTGKARISVYFVKKTEENKCSWTCLCAERRKSSHEVIAFEMFSVPATRFFFLAPRVWNWPTILLDEQSGIVRECLFEGAVQSKGRAGGSRRALSRDRLPSLHLGSPLEFNSAFCGGQRQSCVALGPASSSAAVHLRPAPEPCFLSPGRRSFVGVCPETKQTQTRALIQYNDLKPSLK